MSLQSLSSLISKYPDKADTFDRITKAFSVDSTMQDDVYSLSSLLEKLCLKSSINSILTVKILENEGFISKIFRVESPSLGGLGDYESLTKIPLTVHNWREDTDLRVTPENISILYKIRNNLV
jgi:hypothetical protein